MNVMKSTVKQEIKDLTGGFWHEIRVVGKVKKPGKVSVVLNSFNLDHENVLALKKIESSIGSEVKGAWIDRENHQIQLDFVQWGMEEPMLGAIKELMSELGESQPNFFIRTFPKEMVVNGPIFLSFYQTLEQIFIPYDYYGLCRSEDMPSDAVCHRDIKQLFERFQMMFKSFGLTYECFSKPSLGSEFEIVPTYGEKEVIEDYIKLKKENGENFLCFKRLTEKTGYPDYEVRQYFYSIDTDEFYSKRVRVLEAIEKMKEKALGFKSV